ncbi:hypothetical protein LT709_10320 [Pseudomonas syringae pv. syringae]|uniref:hypothetical protein n=1 Tax=Pseudomonas syringae TaxID=317 RepID=UPI00200AC84A|nr:hypothetical protein [Pseudomonas syringae pv. syringae]MCK9757378.1 hypothetical protein [Pseudomonas syringae pv. syringae]MCK9773607.1 hypothetical protein [Pseudomonas syringae pv. syringae]
MKLLKTYEDRDEAKEAESMLTGGKRLASERDDTSTIYNLFGEATWGNLFKLRLYRLVELKELLSRRGSWDSNDLNLHSDILKLLDAVERNYDLEIPQHWR